MAVELDSLKEFDFDIAISGFDADEIEGMAIGEPEIREYAEEIEAEDEPEPEDKLVHCPYCGKSFEK